MKISARQLIIWMFPTSKGMTSRYVGVQDEDGLVVHGCKIQIDQKLWERRERVFDILLLFQIVHQTLYPQPTWACLQLPSLFAPS